MGRARLLLSDFIVSFMWIWSGILLKTVYKYLDLGHQPHGEIVKCAFSLTNMFFFAFLAKITNGASFNPLPVLSGSISGDFSSFLYCVGARIPVQVLGSITGVKLVIETIPGVGRGPRLNIDIYRGALTEGFLSFAIGVISLGLATKIPGSFFMKTWISSVSKLTLHILGSDLTGGCMNPAAVMGWAYARGDHITKEHIFVYWVAPILATPLAAWTFKLFARPAKEKTGNKSKSD
ncbi:hypothetical protein L6164_009259 [Bauhinia variegata]|uniref:Uncharacterized protein n=1 Tax=Bauhinia variegata TaxID=167791 RepID=A0ACB9PJ61_BAUVA|nr:hypothetical protein L6164_009259 [Bauhinia variegata]